MTNYSKSVRRPELNIEDNYVSAEKDQPVFSVSKKNQEKTQSNADDAMKNL